jgi:hypothetical protein
MLERSCLIVRIVAWTVSLACVVLLVVGIARSAPAPFPKPQHSPVRDLPGTWLMHWQGYKANVVFASNGSFCCLWCGQRWVGAWRVEELPETDRSGQKKYKLIVRESCPPSTPDGAPAWFIWEVALEPGGRKGKLNTGGEFRLEQCQSKPDF